MSRKPETPPPYLGDGQQWAEEVSDYLLRELQRINETLDDLESRIEALEP